MIATILAAGLMSTAPVSADTLKNAVFAPKIEAPARTRGIARTAIERPISTDDRVKAGLGFMCGNTAGHNRQSPLGYDPEGRFVGAKLSFAFR